jgi:5-methylthioribose kinase
MTQDEVGGYLAARGVVGLGSPVEVEELLGGVSNAVFAVETDGARLVVKQSLPQLRVADEWLAKRERILTEGNALRLAAGLTPAAVPSVVDVDGDAFALTIERAPDAWRNWKRVLLDDRADPEVGAELGRILGRWHGDTWGDPDVAASFADYEAFDQLRLDPYHVTVAERLPDAAPRVLEAAAELRDVRRCLVHGDYSPKNVLVGPEGLWVLDFEVAHYGNPVFDLAFMLAHLVLTALHTGRADVRATGEAFLAAYGDTVGEGRAPGEEELALHVGALLLARTDGKSLEDYLDDAERGVARTHALALLDRDGDLWIAA